jgi:hypothetical protein
MDNKGLLNSIWVIVGIVIIFFSIFTCKDVRYLDLSGRYSIKSKKPLGLQLFYELIRKAKGNENVRIDYKFSPYITNSRYTYIAIDEKLEFENEQIKYMLNEGNTVVLMAHELQLDTNFIIKTLISDTLYYIYPSSYQFGDKDTVANPKNYSLEYQNHFHPLLPKADTVHLYADTFPVFSVKKIFGGTLIVHQAPILFTNIAAKKYGFLKHINTLIPYLKGEVIFSHPTNKNDNAKEGLLTEILKVPGLKYAYYFAWILILVYLFFSGRRLQRVVPVISPKKNLSASYVNTISRLYQSQDQKKLLLDRMRENFFHFVQKNYYILHQDPDFISVLSKRTAVPEYTIKMILHMTAADQIDAITDEYIIELNNYIYQFKSIAYYGRST